MKKKIFKYLAYAFLILTIYKVSTKLIAANKTVIDTCLKDKFIEKFGDMTILGQGSTYNFDEVFKCKKWDEIIIIGPYSNSRMFLFFSSGIIVPEFEYAEYPEYINFVFFLNNGCVVSKPIPFGHPDFVFHQNLNRMNYLKVGRKNAIFKYKKGEDKSFDNLATMDLVK